MPDVQHILVQISGPKPNKDDTGRVTTGYYTVTDGVLTMTDGNGTPVRNVLNGETYKMRLRPGVNERAIANRLTLRIYRMLRGEDKETAGFNKPLSYPSVGVA